MIALVLATMVSALSPRSAERSPAVAREQLREIITAIQVHGNTLTSDDEIRQLAGVQVGMPLETDTVDAVTSRLRAAGRFQRIEVLKRFASIADPSQIVLVIVVDEGPVRVEVTGDPAHPTRVVRSGGLRLMFLPVLRYEDGYGATYGVRLARRGVAGRQSRVSFPLTWGGEKRAAAEFEQSIADAPIDRVLAGASISRRTNPFFQQDDDRGRVWARAERDMTRRVRVGAGGGVQRVSFSTLSDRFAHAGADIVLDTRVDPLLPRNAVYARAAWERLFFGARGADTARWELDAKGYLGLVGQSILAVRAQRQDAGRTLPPYLKPLLGGMANLRGLRAGAAAGDTLAAASAELILPLTSPLDIGKIGVSAFIDAGTVYDKGHRFGDHAIERGYGGSVWLSAAFLRVNVAVAHGRGASTRVHVGGNVSF